MIKYLVALFLILSLASCQDSRKTIDILGANDEIKRTVGIDLLMHKSIIDTTFPDDSLYLRICEDILFKTGKSRIHEKFGPTLVYDNGDSISVADRDSLFKCVFQSLAKNIFMEDCSNENMSDSAYCSIKSRAKENLTKIEGVFNLSPTITFGDIYNQLKYGILNYEEFSFLVIVHHLIRDIYYLE